MGLLVDNILIVVEGAKTETRFFKRLSELTNNNIIIIAYNNNIYDLYRCLKDNESIDTIRMLAYGKNNVSEKDKEMLKQNLNKWPYIYLVFDFDYQNSKRLKSVEKELCKIEELLKYFTNEADGKGKLLIDYPMMESYKDLKDFDDIAYLDTFIESDYKLLGGYKNKVSQKGIKKDINSYTKYDFYNIAKINLLKINTILYNRKTLPSFDEYFGTENFNQLKIFNKQKECLFKEKKIVILNCAILLFVDLIPGILKNKKTTK